MLGFFAFGCATRTCVGWRWRRDAAHAREDQPTKWDATIPLELLVLHNQLAKVDPLLDDERFFVPLVPYFHPSAGRPSRSMETYLRLTFFKYRYRLGYETLVAEVGDSLTWRRFCRLPLGFVCRVRPR